MNATASQPEQRIVETSAGPCRLPIEYRDGTLAALFYRVDPGAASRLVDGTMFEPLLFGGRALAILVAFEYRETDIGPYNEIGLAVWTRLRGTRPSRLGLILDSRKQAEQAALIVRLPVTTAIADAAGRQLWGYPKYVAGIKCRFGREPAEISLEGEFQLRIPRPKGISLKGMPFVLYSVLNGRVLRTIVEVRHRTRWGLGRGVRLQITGTGPTADALRQLQLDDRRPMAVFHTDRLRSSLPAGTELGDLRGKVVES